MPDKISPRELRDKFADPNVTEAELEQYIQLDTQRSTAFAPKFRSNPQRVYTQSTELGDILDDINDLSRKRRHRKYYQRLKDGYQGIKIVSEGDSWFQFPILLKDVIDQLDEYAIFSLDAAGDILKNIIQNDEFTSAILAEKPDVFIISAGGNDMVADNRLSQLLHPYDENLQAEDYPNQAFEDFLAEVIGLYKGLFLNLHSRFPDLKMICHGYDYVIPNNRTSLGQPMNSIGITNQTLQKKIMMEIINRINEAQINLVASLPNVYHVDCRSAVDSEQWFDELHPRNAGFESVAERFRQVIQHL